MEELDVYKEARDTRRGWYCKPFVQKKKSSFQEYRRDSFSTDISSFSIEILEHRSEILEPWRYFWNPDILYKLLP